MIKACIDTNIWISGVMFSGAPKEIVEAAFNKKFEVVTSKFILEELERNLLDKFHFSQRNTRRFINRILQISDLYEPNRTIKIIKNHPADNLILETALLGHAKYIVTGDKRHLLPLKTFKNIKVIEATQFLSVLKIRE